MAQKICFVGYGNLPVLSPAYNHHGIGGEQVQHTLLAQALQRRGFDVSMIVGDYGQADGEVFGGIRTHRVYREGTGLPGLQLVHPKWTGLWSAAKRAAADVYYVSCADMHIGELAMFAGRHGARTVFRIASDSDCKPDALLMRRDRLGIKFWTYKQLYFYGIRHTDAILAQSLWQQQAMRAAFGRDSTVARMLVGEQREPLPLDARDLPTLWVSNIRQVKRPDRVLALAARCPQVQWHMVGGAQPDFEAMFEEVSRQAATLPNLRFHGQVPYHDVTDFYRRARLFINTSDVEGFPNSFLQAWAAGTPLVTFFDPDGVVAREKLGIVVANEAEMAAAVTRLLGDAAEWQAYSARCLAYMDAHYGEDAILQPYLDTFASLTGKAR